MAFVVARLITLPTVALASAWLIKKYRALGVLISIFAGWIILFAAYQVFPAPPGIWDEDGEEIYYTAPILMMLWCFPVWGAVSLWSSLKKGKKEQLS